MEQRDEQLWKLAKKRANTKRNGLVYLTIIVFLWIIWLSNNDFTFGFWWRTPHIRSMDFPPLP